MISDKYSHESAGYQMRHLTLPASRQIAMEHTSPQFLPQDLVDQASLSHHVWKTTLAEFLYHGNCY